MPAHSVAASVNGSIMSKDARRKKAEELQQREAAKARISRLATMLTHKYIVQFGSKREPGLNDKIQSTIHEFLRRVPMPSDSDIGDLENSLKELRSEMLPSSRAKGEIRLERGEDGNMNGTAGRSGSAARNQMDDANKQKLAQSGTDITRDWRAFDVAKQIEYEEVEKKKMAKVLLEKARFRAELSYQRVQHEEARRIKAETDKRYLDEQNALLNQWRLEQEAVKSKIHKTHEEEKRIRALQIAEQQRRRDAEKEDKLRHEHEETERARRGLEEEAANIERRKQVARACLMQIQHQNATHKVEVEKKAALVAEEDVRLMQEAIRKQEIEDKAHVNNMKQRTQRYERIGNIFTTRPDAAKETAEKLRMEKQAAEEGEAKLREQIDREIRDKEKKKMGAIATALDNKRAIEERREKRAADEAQQKHWSDITLAEAAAHRQAEAERIQKQRAKMQKYRAELEKQAAENQRRKQKVEMSDTEMRLNADMVRKLETNPELQSSVRARLRAT